MPPYRPREEAAAPPPPPPPPPPPEPEPAAGSTERLVQDAREHVGGLHDQLEELLRFRDQLAEAATALVEDYSRVLEQIARATAPVAPPPPPGAATFAVPPPAPPSGEGSLFNGHVAIDAGPFGDIATLAAFEQALGRVPHAQDVYVRSFEGHRALIELRLSGTVALVFELRRVCEQAFDVEAAEPGRLTLAMHASAKLPFPMRPANEHEAPPAPPGNGGRAD
jgi:hypothetical protein